MENENKQATQETLADALAAARAMLDEDGWIDEITAPDEDGEPNDYAQRVVRVNDVCDALDRIEAAAELERVKARHDAEIEWTRIGYDERKAEEKRAPVTAPRKFDEAAFDAAVAKPNGWSDVADPVAEIRRMRDGDATGNVAALREALVEILDRTNKEKARDPHAAIAGGILEIHDIANTALHETKGE